MTRTTEPSTEDSVLRHSESGLRQDGRTRTQPVLSDSVFPGAGAAAAGPGLGNLKKKPGIPAPDPRG